MASLVCATCRKLIPPGTNAIRCTVASCNTGRMKLRFCSATCWEKHVPTARHRNASYVVEGERDAAAVEPAAEPDSTVEPSGESKPAGE
jgi:LSD1 subclass zinc finger protein